jgi:serine/threonine protein phosphatase 1
MIYYAIGDIHGHLELLEPLLAKIEADAAARPGPKSIVYLGDYVDRGPDSAGVVSRIMAGPPPGIDNQIALLGNHEDLMIDFQAGVEPAASNWTDPDMGGADTIISYLGDWDLFSTHAAWMRSLPLCHLADGYLFVHAGIFPGRPLERQRREDFIWIRDRFLDWELDHGFIVVHGHTPRRPWGVDWLHNRINVDSGAAWGGPLSCAVLGGDVADVLQVWPETL